MPSTVWSDRGPLARVTKVSVSAMGPSDSTGRQEGREVSEEEYERRRKALTKTTREELASEEKLVRITNVKKEGRGHPSARGQGIVESYDNAEPRRESAGEMSITATEGLLSTCRVPANRYGDSAPSAGVAATLDYAHGGSKAVTQLSNHWVPSHRYPVLQRA